MSITDKEDLIFSDLEGNIQCISKKELKEAWSLYRKTLSNVENKPFCANYERDNMDAYNLTAKWVTSDTMQNLNGFNNGIDASDGIGGEKPFFEEKLIPKDKCFDPIVEATHIIQ